MTSIFLAIILAQFIYSYWVASEEDHRRKHQPLALLNHEIAVMIFMGLSLTFFLSLQFFVVRFLERKNTRYCFSILIVPVWFAAVYLFDFIVR